MFSNLTSYIFGSKSEAEEAVDAAVAAPEEARNGQVGGDPKKRDQKQQKPEEQGDWVLLDEDDDGEVIDEGESEESNSLRPGLKF